MESFSDTLAAYGAQRRVRQERHLELDGLSADLAARPRLAISRSRMLLADTHRKVEATKWIREIATDSVDGRSPGAPCSR